MKITTFKQFKRESRKAFKRLGIKEIKTKNK